MPDWKCSIPIKKQQSASLNVLWYYRSLVLDNGVSSLRRKIKLDKIVTCVCKFLRYQNVIYLYVLYKFSSLVETILCMVFKHSLICFSILVFTLQSDWMIF